MKKCYVIYWIARTSFQAKTAEKNFQSMILSPLLDCNMPEVFITSAYQPIFYGVDLMDQVFFLAMSRTKFKNILRNLRFDLKTTRRVPVSEDKFAPIRETFDSFCGNCVKAYTPSMNLTVDEQLLPVKNRCKLITFMPNKPDKYGIKFWLLVEVESKYVCNIIPYLGAEEKEKRGTQTLATNVVLRLMEPFKNKGYNVCCDNFFTSMDIARRLSEISTTIVGTIRKNRRELAKNMIASDCGFFESKFFWNEEVRACFVAYQCKKNKNVYLLSTMHSSPSTSDNPKKKPITIEFYNQNKVGVDVVDQMTELYTTKSASRRWPLAIWSNILDIAAINSWILYRKTAEKQISRRGFILELIRELISSSQPSADLSVTLPPEITETYPPTKRRKCQHAGCRNNSSSYCKRCMKVTCGTCALEGKVTFVKCKFCAD